MAWIVTDNPVLDVLGALPGVRIADAAGRNRGGRGFLRIMGAGLASWRAPGSDSFGDTIDVSAGGSFYLGDGSDPSRWVELAVTAARLGGTYGQTAVRLGEPYANAISNADVTAAEAASGLIDDWSFELTNRTGGAVTLRLYLDVYTAQWHTLSINGADYSAPTRWADGLELVFAASETKTVYLRRTVPAGAPPRPAGRVRVRWRAAAGAEVEFGEVSGLYRVFGPPEYRIYLTDGRAPQPGHDVPVETCSSLPHTLTDPPGDGDWYVAVTYFNGVLESPVGLVQRLRIESGDEGLLPPSGPQNLVLEQRAGGVVRVHATYAYASDPPEMRANYWSVGVSLDGGPALTYKVPMRAPRGWGVLAYDLAAQSDGVVQAIELRMDREIGPVNVLSVETLTGSITTSVPEPAAPVAAGFAEGRRT